MNLVLEKVLSLDNGDLPLAISLESEFNISHEMAVELVTATKMIWIIFWIYLKDLNFKKMISVIGLILERNKNTI